MRSALCAITAAIARDSPVIVSMLSSRLSPILQLMIWAPAGWPGRTYSSSLTSTRDAHELRVMSPFPERKCKTRLPDCQAISSSHTQLAARLHCIS